VHLGRRMIRDFVKVTLGPDDVVLQWSSGAVLERHFRSVAGKQHGLVGKRVLELGSGTGFVGCALAEVCCMVVVSSHIGPR
jgi:predicted nicotinamide N-methyase